MGHAQHAAAPGCHALFAVVLALGGCGSTGGDHPNDAAATVQDGGRDGKPAADGGRDVRPPDQGGYAIVGADLYPPLQHRIAAIPCRPDPAAECTRDDDCGAGRACVCSDFIGGHACRPAECRTDGDCAGGLCLLSGPRGRCACSGWTAGLYCERPDSLCKDSGDCPGNGVACVFVGKTNRFECGGITCTTCQ
jgi:hypothetical protein